jgi:hypothetical protein
MKKLIEIQNELKAPKSQYNSFGKYKYRNCEDVLEALKPLLKAKGCTLTITDEIKEVCGLVYVEATATIFDGQTKYTVKAQAGIDANRKGMDIAQSFGSSSSYARKYCLNGLFLIDDTKDVDSVDNTNKPVAKKTASKPTLKTNTKEYRQVFDGLRNGFTMDQVKSKYTVSKSVESQLLKELGNEAV